MILNFQERLNDKVSFFLIWIGVFFYTQKYRDEKQLW